MSIPLSFVFWSLGLGTESLEALLDSSATVVGERICSNDGGVGNNLTKSVGPNGMFVELKQPILVEL